MKYIQNIKIWLLKPLQAVIILSAAFTCTHVLSAERIILGNPQAISLSAAQDPAIAATFSELKKKAKTSGTVRVIVGVRVPFAPEGKLELAEQTKQRSEIAIAQKSVLAKVPQLTGTNREPNRLLKYSPPSLPG